MSYEVKAAQALIKRVFLLFMSFTCLSHPTVFFVLLMNKNDSFGSLELENELLRAFKELVFQYRYNNYFILP